MHLPYIALVSTAVLGFLLFGLGLTVSLMRGKYNIHIGHPEDPQHILHRIIRAHANTAEYAPFLAIMFLYLGSHQPTAWVLWAIGLTTAARVLIVIGLLTAGTLTRPHPVRFIGALGTYVGGLALSVALVTGT